MLDASLWSMALVKKINSPSVRLTKVYFSDSGIKLKARDGLFEVAITHLQIPSPSFED